MKTALEVDITYDQVLALVRQLATSEKIKLSEELEKEGIKSKLSKILQTFQTTHLSQKKIDEEVDIVRQQIYAKQK